MVVLLHVDVYGSLDKFIWSITSSFGFEYGWFVCAIELNTSEPSLIAIKV